MKNDMLDRAYSTYGKKGSTYKSLVTTSEGTRTLERLPLVLECNIKVGVMD